jgi:hypothetical protein
VNTVKVDAVVNEKYYCSYNKEAPDDITNKRYCATNVDIIFNMYSKYYK